jgi:hypothetical protein
MQMAAGLVMSQNAVRDELCSARPDAPIVPHVERRPRSRALRLAVAAAAGPDRPREFASGRPGALLSGARRTKRFERKDVQSWVPTRDH